MSGRASVAIGVITGVSAYLLRWQWQGRSGDMPTAVDNAANALCWGGLMWAGLDLERRPRERKRAGEAKLK